jgi:hypothetical protein
MSLLQPFGPSCLIHKVDRTHRTYNIQISESFKTTFNLNTSTKYLVNSCSNFGDEIYYLPQLPYQKTAVSILNYASDLIKDSDTVLRLKSLKIRPFGSSILSTIRSYLTLTQYTHRTEMVLTSNRVIVDANGVNKYLDFLIDQGRTETFLLYVV